MKYKKCSLLILVGISIIGFYSMVGAAVPKLINFEGKLTDSSGDPITGTKSIQFKIYTVESGGVPVWNETQSVDLDSKGFYSVRLGSVQTLDVDFNADYWLGVTVESDSEMIPRYRLSSVGSAINADMVDGKHAAATGNDIIPITDGTGKLDSSVIPGGSGDMLKSTYDTGDNGIVDNSEQLGGNSPGNASGNIPISNGTVCTNLNADKLDGQDASAFAGGFIDTDKAYLADSGWIGSTEIDLVSVTVTVASGQSVLLMYSCWVRQGGAGGYIDFDINGSVESTLRISIVDTDYENHSVSRQFLHTPGSGTWTYTLRASTSESSIRAERVVLIAIVG